MAAWPCLGNVIFPDVLKGIGDCLCKSGIACEDSLLMLHHDFDECKSSLFLLTHKGVHLTSNNLPGMSAVWCPQHMQQLRPHTAANRIKGA